MIRSFSCADAQTPFGTGRTRRFGSIAQIATRMLVQPDNAVELRDLGSLPGTRIRREVRVMSTAS
jgi:hypothetical protein